MKLMTYVSLNAKTICTVPLWFNPFTLNDTPPKCLLFDWITLNLVAPVSCQLTLTEILRKAQVAPRKSRISPP